MQQQQQTPQTTTTHQHIPTHTPQTTTTHSTHTIALSLLLVNVSETEHHYFLQEEAHFIQSGTRSAKVYLHDFLDSINSTHREPCQGPCALAFVPVRCRCRCRCRCVAVCWWRWWELGTVVVGGRCGGWCEMCVCVLCVRVRVVSCMLWSQFHRLHLRRVKMINGTAMKVVPVLTDVCAGRLLVPTQMTILMDVTPISSTNFTMPLFWISAISSFVTCPRKFHLSGRSPTYITLFVPA